MTPAVSDELSAENVTRAYERLQLLPCNVNSLEAFMDSWSDVARWVRQGESYVHWNRHRDVEDERALEAYTGFYGPITEAAQRGEVTVRQKFLSLDPAELPSGWQQLRRTFEADERSSVPTSPGLLERQSLLVSNFVNALHAIRVDFDGEPTTVSGLNRHARNPDRALRERAWRALDATMLEHFSEFAADFAAVLEVRAQLATASGNASFVGYHWWTRNRSDYTPADCVTLSDAVASHFGPLLERFHARKCDRLEIESVRPWDLRFEPDVGPAGLKVAPSLEAIGQVLNGLHPRLAEVYDRIRGAENPSTGLIPSDAAKRGLERFDLELRAGKSGASFSDYWCVPRHPVVMMNFAGSADDLGLLVHELGHALHYTLAGECQDLYWGLPHSLEFMEFNSHFLELLVLERLGAAGLIFDAEALALARQNQARVILNQLMHVCRADRFQQWVYTASADHLGTPQFANAYLEIARPFQPGVNWDELETSLARAWLDEGLFTQPLYKIEYAFAWVGGLLLLDACLPTSDRNETHSGSEGASAEAPGREVNLEIMDRWIAALEAGNTLSTAELFRSVGLSFPFTSQDVARAAQVYGRLFSSFL